MSFFFTERMHSFSIPYIVHVLEEKDGSLRLTRDLVFFPLLRSEEI